MRRETKTTIYIATCVVCYLLLWVLATHWTRYEMNRCAPDLAAGPLNSNANYVITGAVWPLALPVLLVASTLPCPGDS